MNLVPRRRRSKSQQAIDVLARAAKTWSEWQLAKKAGQGVRKAAGAGAARGLTSTKGLGALVIAGGLGVAAIKKLKGSSDDAASTYSPPVQPPPGPTPPAAPVATPGSPGVGAATPPHPGPASPPAPESSVTPEPPASPRVTSEPSPPAQRSLSD